MALTSATPKRPGPECDHGQSQDEQRRKLFDQALGCEILLGTETVRAQTMLGINGEVRRRAVGVQGLCIQQRGMYGLSLMDMLHTVGVDTHPTGQQHHQGQQQEPGESPLESFDLDT